MMKLEDGVAGSAVVVCVGGRVDAANAPLLEAHGRRQLEEHGRKSLVLDLSTVEYLSSAGLRAILVLGKHTQSLGGKLALCGVTGTVRQLFELAGLLDLFPVADSLEKAVGLVMGGPR